MVNNDILSNPNFLLLHVRSGFPHLWKIPVLQNKILHFPDWLELNDLQV